MEVWGNVLEQLPAVLEMWRGWFSLIFSESDDVVGNNTERGGVNQYYQVNKTFSFPNSDSYILLPQLLMIKLIDLQ